MGRLNKFRRKQTTTITAVRLELDTAGFTYQKWGAEQRCKPGDWIVNNAGDTYTIDAGVFASTYREVAPGVYQKVGPVWATRASEDGTILTKEGSTAYRAGDVLVFNDAAGSDGYAMSADKFESLYEPEDQAC